MSIEKFKVSVETGDVLGAVIACQSINNLSIPYKELEYDTPLMYAAYCGVSSVVEVLIDAGADVNIQRDNRWTALHYATKCGHIECASILLSNEAQIGILNDSGWTALEYACRQNNKDMVELLLNKCMEPHSTKDITSALSIVVMLKGNLEIARMLLEAGASVDVQLEYIGTVLDEARSVGQKDMIELLESCQSSQGALC